MDNKYSIADKYFIIWAFFIPISSWAIAPSIKGSLMSYLFAFLSPFIVVFFYKDIFKNYILDILKIILVLIFFLCVSQFANLLFDIKLLDITLVNPGEISDKVFRTSSITQSLYLMPVILTLLYIRYFYKTSWDKWIIYSGLVFVLYGFYKWGMYLIAGIDADFLTNRTFGDLDGSLKFQLINVAGITMQRFQSLTGEPSMYSFTTLPYFIFAIHKKANPIIIALIGLSLLISTSSVAYAGLSIYLIYIFICSKKNKNFFYALLGIAILSMILYGIFYEYINDVFEQMILNKADSQSSEVRSANFDRHLMYILNLDYFHFLFGIGFGYIRSDDLFSTLLVNTGLIGIITFAYFYLKDFSFRIKSFETLGYNAIILVLFIVSMTSVAEFSYLSYWLFLGIVQNRKKNNLL